MMLLTLQLIIYYPIENGMMNIEKAIEDIKFIIEINKKRGD